MDLKTRLESNEGKWIRVHFQDSSFLTGRLMCLGTDFVHIECFGRDDTRNPEPGNYAQHLVPMNLVKLITVESSSFFEAERRRLEYIAKKPCSIDGKINSINLGDFEDI